MFTVLGSKAVHVRFVTNNIGPWKSCGKTVYWRPNHWILNFPLTFGRHIFTSGGWSSRFVTSLTWTPLLLRTVKLMLYLGNILLRLPVESSRIANISTSECEKTVFFFLVPAIFFELTITQTPYNSNFFRFFLHISLKGSSYRKSTVNVWRKSRGTDRFRFELGRGSS